MTIVLAAIDLENWWVNWSINAFCLSLNIFLFCIQSILIYFHITDTMRVVQIYAFDFWRSSDNGEIIKYE